MANNREHSGFKVDKDKLRWWQLSLLGVAFTIGTGYFLGSGIAIKIGGPGAILSFAVAAFGTYIVFDLLARMTSQEPLAGSFRSYAKKAFGRWAGFSSGWVYWSSELLIMGSQMTALALFTRFWFPNVPLWVFAAAYGTLGILIILLGTHGFEKSENVFAVIKVSAIVIFVVVATIALFGVFGGGKYTPHFPATIGEYLAQGPLGLWSSLLFAFYAFGGIEIMGIMAMRLQDPKEAPKAGKVMLLTLAVIYIASIVLAITLVPWRLFNHDKSPFLMALEQFNLPFVPHVFNSILIIAGFSTMVASMFAITTMLVTLAKDNDAPRFFTKKVLHHCPLPAIALTAAGLVVSVVFSLLMPGRIYEYVTTAAGLMLLYNWFFILVTSGRLLKLSGFNRAKQITGMIILAGAITGSLFHETSRPGFYVSFLFAAVIAGVTLFMRSRWKKQDRDAQMGPRTIGMEFQSTEQKLSGLKAKVRPKAD